MKKDKKLIKKLLEKIKNSSDPTEGYEQLIDYYISVGMEDEAVSTLERFLEIKKDHEQAESYLGMLYFNRGDIVKAEERFLRALKINPEMKDASFNLGFLYKLAKKYGEALLFFKKVIDRDPADTEALFNVAECCRELGKNRDAQFFYQNTLKLNPDHEEAKKGLEEVKRFVSDIAISDNKDVLKILFVQEFPEVRNYKMAKALKSRGHRVSLAYTQAKLSQVYNLSDDIYYELIPVKKYRQLWDISKCYDIIHCHNEPDILTVNCLACDTLVIHDVHDLISLRDPDNPNLKYFEGIANRGADGRVYSTHLQMKEANRMYGIDVDNSMVLFNYVSKDDVPSKYKRKLSEIDGKIHIVYEGSIRIDSGHRNYMPIFKEIAKNKLHIHIYPSFHVEEYEKEFINNPYVHYNKPISPNEIIYEMTQFDFGIIPFVESDKNTRHLNSAVPNKLFEYLAAGLPVIASDLEGIRYFIEKDNVGIVYKNIDDILNSVDKLKNIKIENKVYTVEDEIDKLIEFYRKIISKRNSPIRRVDDERKREHLKKVYSKGDRINDLYKNIDVDTVSKKINEERISKIVSMVEGDVLEVGCGGGIMSILVGQKGHKCVGIDPVVELINTAKLELSSEPEDIQKMIRFDVAWAEDMPFDDNCFDTVILSEVLEHVMDLDITLNQVKRVLKPDGKIISTIPNGDTKHSAHVRVFNPDSFKNIMDRYFVSTENIQNSKHFIWYVGKNN